MGEDGGVDMHRFGAENGGADEQTLENRRDDLVRFLIDTAESGRRLPLDVDLASMETVDNLAISKALESINRKCHQGDGKQSLADASALPSTILFPYSRHSSYPELCHLVDTFRPRDVWPCTVHPEPWITNGQHLLRRHNCTSLTVTGMSINLLFGSRCRGEIFAHDEGMKLLAAEMEQERRLHDTQHSQRTTEIDDSAPVSSPVLPLSSRRPSGKNSEVPYWPVARPSQEAVEIDSEMLELASDLPSESSVSYKLRSTDSRARIDAYLQMRAHARGEESEPIFLVSTASGTGDIELGDSQLHLGQP
jgi:DNA cross-link repair 1C protein